MSDLCTYCGVVSRAACSTYKREYLEAEIRSCPNLEDSRRSSALYSAGFHEASRLMDELDDLRAENGRLRAAIAKATGAAS